LGINLAKICKINDIKVKIGTLISPMIKEPMLNKNDYELKLNSSKF